MANITIGQYYHENSIIHKLDPRVKLFGTLVYIVALFVSNNYIGYAATILSLAVVIKISKVPFLRLCKGLKAILIVLIFGVVFNILFTEEGYVLFQLWKIRITDYGISNALFIGLRLTLLVVGTSVMTLTTKPADLSDGLEKAFGFMKKIKVPVHEIAMIMSLALRFIPTLMDETEKIKKAQKARGADFDGNNMLEKVKSFLPLLIPLFISSINRALELAVAMEARCYNGGNRTKLHPLVHKKQDYYAYAVLMFFMAGIVAINYAMKISALEWLVFKR